MASASGKVDRQTTTPFYLRLFYRSGSFHRLDEFQPLAELPPHLQIYTWPSCTLRELSHIVTGSLPTLLPDPAIGTRIAFRLIYPEPIPRNAPASVAAGPGKFIMRDLGSVVIGADSAVGILPDEEETAIIGGGQLAGPLGGEPEKMLQDSIFKIGDYIACAILPPNENGSVAPPPSAPARGFGAGRGDFGARNGGMGPRENGYGMYRGRGGSRGGGNFGGFVPPGEWRRGERVPEGPSGGRGRGFGGGRVGRY